MRGLVACRRIYRDNRKYQGLGLLHWCVDYDSSPNSEHINASMVENRGKVVSAPQCVQRTLQIVSVCAMSNMAASTSPTGTVRITAAHSLNRISASPARTRTIRQPLQSTSAMSSCGMIGRPTLFTSMSTVGKREVVDRAPVSVAKSAAIPYAASLVRTASSTCCCVGHLRLQRRPLLPALSRWSGRFRP
jgi:hypothetical protein